MAYIRDTYGVPVKRGAVVTFCGLPARILSARGAHLRIKVDGESGRYLVHPTWEMVYAPKETPR